MTRRWRNRCFTGFCGLLGVYASGLVASLAAASPRGDSLEAAAGVGALSVYGKSIETLTRANPYFVARYVKDLSSGWGGLAEYLGSTGSGFDGFTLGVSYDLSPFVFADSGSDFAVHDGTVVERYSLWRLRALVGGGVWNYSGVVNTTGETRIPKRAISATIYGTSLNVVLERMISRSLALQVQTHWMTGFAADFGGQQVSVAAGMSWVGL